MAAPLQTGHDIVGCLHVVFDDQDVHEGRTGPRGSSGVSSLMIRDIAEARHGSTCKSVTDRSESKTSSRRSTIGRKNTWRRFIGYKSLEIIGFASMQTR